MTVKTYIVSKDGIQTITNKTIYAENNVIRNIDTGNLKQQTAGTDLGKTYLVKADGTWELGKIQQYKRVSTFASETGNASTLYYLDVNYDGGHPVGLYIYDTGTNKFVPCSIAGNVLVDNVTIEMNPSNEISVKDSGLTVAKFNASAISLGIPETGTSNTKLPTEKAVKDLVNTSAYSLEFTMNPTTFVISAILRDRLGNVLSTQSVDLPLEQMVVNVTYDNTSESFIFTLKNGTTITVPASGIMKGVVTQSAEQTLTDKTINIDDRNKIRNLGASNFRPKTSADVNKAYIVGSDGNWYLGNIQQFKHVSTFTGVTGNPNTLYYLDTNYTGFIRGLYVYETDTLSFVPAVVTGSVVIDNITIGTNPSGEFEVKDGGLTVAKFANTAITTTITSPPVDTKIPTEKAVYSFVVERVPFAPSTQSKAFSFGEDSDGYFIEE